jgi:hypothetical protein
VAWGLVEVLAVLVLMMVCGGYVVVAAVVVEVEVVEVVEVIVVPKIKNK